MEIEDLEIDVKYKKNKTLLNFRDESFIEISNSKIKFFTVFNSKKEYNAEILTISKKNFKEFTWKIYKGKDFIVLQFIDHANYEEIIFDDSSIKYKTINNMLSRNDGYILLFDFIFDFISEEMTRLKHNNFTG